MSCAGGTAGGMLAMAQIWHTQCAKTCQPKQNNALTCKG